MSAAQSVFAGLYIRCCLGIEMVQSGKLTFCALEVHVYLLCNVQVREAVSLNRAHQKISKGAGNLIFGVPVLDHCL